MSALLPGITLSIHRTSNIYNQLYFISFAGLRLLYLWKPRTCC